jgi:hypothetical protein
VYMSSCDDVLTGTFTESLDECRGLNNQLWGLYISAVMEEQNMVHPGVVELTCHNEIYRHIFNIVI